MFETVVPETFHARSRKLLYETLPLSIAIHATVIGAVFLNTLWTVAFPDHSPALVAAYTLADLPEPPPPPPTPVPAAPKPVANANPGPPPPPPPPQLLNMAPRVIPNLVPRVVAIEVPPPPVAAPPAAVAEGSPQGVEGGELCGKIGGQIGGRPGGAPGGIVFPDDGRVYVDRDEKLPLVEIRKDPPQYPEDARKLRLEDSVVVRYVIGTNGRVKDVTILDHARNPMFDKPTVDAISEWRFEPLKRNGKRVEVVHELTIFYQMVFR